MEKIKVVLMLRSVLYTLCIFQLFLCKHDILTLYKHSTNYDWINSYKHNSDSSVTLQTMLFKGFHIMVICAPLNHVICCA